MSSPAISGRMELLVEMLGQADTLADVGCDHGYVGITAIQRGKAQSVISMDINTGPLEAAKRNAATYGTFDKTQFRLSDGLDALNPQEADAILIAGMGGRLMADILSRGRMVARRAKQLIVSPQSDLPYFRRFILDEGYGIKDERMLFEDGKYYFLFDIRPGETFSYPNREAGIEYGGILLEKADETLYEYLLWQKKLKLDILNRLAKTDNMQTLSQAEQISGQLEQIDMLLNTFYRNGGTQ